MGRRAVGLAVNWADQERSGNIAGLAISGMSISDL